MFQRLKRLWKLSEFEPGNPQDEYKEPGTRMVTLVKKPQQKAIFISRIKNNPVEEIINEQPQ